MQKPDLDSPERIRFFIDRFYDKVLVDELLAHIFIDVAGIDIHQHLPMIASYWEKLLLGDTSYKRHTMNIHRHLHQKFPFTRVEFDRWLTLFVTAANEHFEGANTQRAIQIATSIAENMDKALNSNIS